MGEGSVSTLTSLITYELIELLRRHSELYHDKLCIEILVHYVN